MTRALLLVIALGALPAPLAAQEAPLLRGDSLLPFRGGTILWVRNPGPDTVWVDTLFLTACRNVQPRCGAIPLGLPVAPNEGRRLLRITPQMPRQALGYHWTFSWRVVTREELEDEPEDSS
ncbi:MAG TPA: hypothetical protein VG940_12370 [Gemmatimonadales bacterium]|nr:hypothetical protein [Gemmatimonadales bacterium]